MRVKRIGNHTLPLPKQAHDGDAGYDLMAVENMEIWPDEQILVKTGFAFEIPRGLVGIIKDRSGNAAKLHLYTSAGVIDSSYRGEVMVCLRSQNNKVHNIHSGDKIAQMILVPYLSEITQEVDDLDDTSRGVYGFGSTGK